jgi:hypothetical protein
VTRVEPVEQVEPAKPDILVQLATLATLVLTVRRDSSDQQVRLGLEDQLGLKDQLVYMAEQAQLE